MNAELWGHMSHELRTPLNIIIGFAELLHSDLVEDPAQRKEYLNDILVSGQHLLRLIDDILDLSKIETGTIQFHPKAIELGSLVNESLALVREPAAKTRIDIITDIEPLPLQLSLDPTRLKQVLYSFLSNAVKFTPCDGSVTVRGRVEGDEVRLEVRDTGVGLAADTLDEVFNGSGLGLPLAKSVVTAQGGRVGVSSRPGVGSTFFATLPVRMLDAPNPTR